jgi:cyclopropane fatty-acyl-phospholipid synthase-like methyltransferase
MSQSGRVDLFDKWARDYDVSVSDGEFPFDGYEDVLDRVVRQAGAGPHMRILDLGIGTGNLARRFVREGCAVWGLDFSTEMLAQARLNLPQAKLVRADLLGDWPAELSQPFDRVVSAYVLHEFDLETKLRLLQRIASRHLAVGGRIVIADIAFATVVAREEASRRWAAAWDEDEFYWAADEAIAAAEQAGLHGVYEQVSGCGGIFTFTVREAS